MGIILTVDVLVEEVSVCSQFGLEYTGNVERKEAEVKVGKKLTLLDLS